jgi:hypothetical protein
MHFGIEIIIRKRCYLEVKNEFLKEKRQIRKKKDVSEGLG